MSILDRPIFTPSEVKTVPIVRVAGRQVFIARAVDSGLMWQLQRAAADSRFALLQAMYAENHVPVGDARFDVEITAVQRAVDAEATGGRELQIPDGADQLTYYRQPVTPVVSTDADRLLNQYLDAVRAGDKAIGRRARLEAELEQLDTADRARLEAPDALRKAALWYARRGLPVFPLTPRNKTPITQRGFKDATTDVGQVTRWWAAEPQANIGAPTGVLFDVVDIDGPAGVRAVLAADDEWRVNLIGHSLTGGGNAHHHLFYPPSGGGNTSRVLPEVDTRGAGGYVVLPPSVTAGRYRWLPSRPLQLSA